MHAERNRHSSAELRLPAAIRADLDLPKYQPLDRDAERQVAESIWSAREAAWSVILSESVARGHAASLLGLGAEMADMLSAATVARHDQDDAALRACVAHLSPGAAKAAAVCLARVDAAVRRLERHNVKLVLYVIARWFRDLTDPARSPFEVGDLLGWGSLGCRTAAARFDPATGNKFSTFATWWIRATIARESQDARYRLRIPIGMQEHIAAVRKAETALEADGVHHADDKTIARMTGLSLVTTKAARQAMRLHAAPSLDSPLRTADGDGTPGAFIDAIEDRDAASEADLAEQMDLARRQALLGAALSTLSERERFIVEARHGLGVWQGDEATLSDIGEVFGVSRERVRVVEAAAMFKVGREVRRAMARKADASDAVSC